MTEKEINHKLKDEIKELKRAISEEGVQSGNNLEYLYKLVDIEKDLCDIEKESDFMRYGRYGNSYGDNYGRYSARGYDAKYRGDEVLNDMYGNYGRYSESREAYGRGNYGAKEDTMMSLEYMLKNVVDFVKMLKEDAESPEEVEMIRKYARKISEM